MLSYLPTDSAATDERFPKLNFSFEFFNSIYVYIFAWNLIPKKASFETVFTYHNSKYSWQLTSIDNYTFL